MSDHTSAHRPPPDQLLVDNADYVSSRPVTSLEAYDTARLCLMDSLGCMMLALGFTACTDLLGAIVPGAGLPGGARGPGAKRELDPRRAAFGGGTLVRGRDYNGTWLGAQPGPRSGKHRACPALA